MTEAATESWGVLHPADMPSTRRQQSLDLGRSVRWFNEQSVPGIGNLHFAMPLIWALLGVDLARATDRQPIAVAEGIEALVMKRSLGNADPARLRGFRNLPRAGWSYADLTRRGAYVTQTLRQVCTQPLRALGLVTGSAGRFNSFELTDAGRRLIAPYAEERAGLRKWIDGKPVPKDGLLDRLRPDAVLADGVSRELRQLLLDGDRPGTPRRRAVRENRDGLSTAALLQGTSPLADDHLRALRGGIALVQLRDTGISVLNAVENRLMQLRRDGKDQMLPIPDALDDEKVNEALARLRSLGALHEARLEAAGSGEAIRFARTCRSDAATLLRDLAKRDRSVILLRDDDLVPGPACGETHDEAGPADDRDFARELPRLSALHALIDDLERTA